MAEPMGLMLAAFLCMGTRTNACVQPTDRLSSVQAGVAVPDVPKRIVLRLGGATRFERIHFAASPAVLPASVRSTRATASKHKAIKWGVQIGAAAGLVGGVLGLTHKDGEFMFGSDPFTNGLAFAGIGAGVGALIGFAIEKIRN